MYKNIFENYKIDNSNNSQGYFSSGSDNLSKDSCIEEFNSSFNYVERMSNGKKYSWKIYINLVM